MKTTIIILLISSQSFLYAQGLFNNGAKVITGNQTFIVLIGNNADINNTAQGSIDNRGIIVLQGNWINDSNNALLNSDTTGTVIFNGNYTQFVKGLAPTTFNNIVINNLQDIVLEQSILVSRSLKLSTGKLVLHGSELTVGSPGFNGLITGFDSTNYIVSGDSSSKFIRYCIDDSISYFFPIGDELSYTPLSLYFNNASALNSASQLSVVIVKAPHPLRGSATNYLSRYWTVKPINILSNANYNITYAYDISDVVGIEAGMFPTKYNSSGWLASTSSGAINTMGNGVVDPGNHTVKWNGLYSFSDFTAFGNVSPLPISLLNFEVYQHQENVETKWSTATETNNDYFTIEKSKDAMSFIGIGKIKGAGNSNEKLDYYFTDTLPFEGYSYYRLKQTDFDGNYSYSKIKEVNFTESKKDLIKVYPNPVKLKGLYIKTSELESNYLQLKLMNITGNIVLEQKINIYKKGDLQYIDLIGIASGVYFLKINTGTEEETIKLLIDNSEQ